MRRFGCIRCRKFVTPFHKGIVTLATPLNCQKNIKEKVSMNFIRLYIRVKVK
jgi:hypothetical protein